MVQWNTEQKIFAWLNPRNTSRLEGVASRLLFQFPQLFVPLILFFFLSGTQDLEYRLGIDNLIHETNAWQAHKHNRNTAVVDHSKPNASVALANLHRLSWPDVIELQIDVWFGLIDDEILNAYVLSECVRCGEEEESGGDEAELCVVNQNADLSG
jgi:hypothetical protein